MGGHITYFLVFGPWCTFLMVCLVIPENEPWAPRLTALVPQNPDDCSRHNRIGIDIILTLSTNSVNRNYILLGRALTSLPPFYLDALLLKKLTFTIALDSVDQWHYRCFWLITIRKGQSKQSFKLFLRWEREKWRLQGKLFYESNAHRFIVIFSLVLSLFVCRGRLMMLQQVALNNLKWRLADTAKVKLDNVLEMMCFYPG